MYKVTNHQIHKSGISQKDLETAYNDLLRSHMLDEDDYEKLMKLYTQNFDDWITVNKSSDETQDYYNSEEAMEEWFFAEYERWFRGDASGLEAHINGRLKQKEFQGYVLDHVTPITFNHNQGTQLNYPNNTTGYTCVWKKI